MQSNNTSSSSSLSVLLPEFNNISVNTIHSSKITISNIVNSRHVVIFSPHLDDAILSMGSVITHITKHAASVTILSIFTNGSPLSSALTTKLLTQANCNDAEEYFLIRQHEDKQAIRLLDDSIGYTHFAYIDAAWRMNNTSPLYPQTTLNSYNTADDALKVRIQKKLEELRVDELHTVTFLPLARGRHVDHIITRDIGTAIFQKPIYYGDFPYSQSFANEYNFITTHHLREFTWYGTVSEYKKKANALQCYRSQHQSLSNNKPLQLEPERLYIPQELLPHTSG